jgi:hypothetical protein
MSTASKFSSAFICAVMGVIIYIAASWIPSGDALEGGTTVTGRVIATPPSQEGDTCGKRVLYHVDGVPYEVSAGYSSSGACDDIGSTAEVSYLPSSPSSARVIDDQIRWFGLGFKVLGVAMLVWAVVQLVSAVRALTSGPSDVVAGSVPGQQDFDLGDLTFAEPAPEPGRGAHPPPLPQPAVAPPPGWYLDPGGSQNQRWWDGRLWTEHLR